MSRPLVAGSGCPVTPIPGFPGYHATEDGGIWSAKRGPIARLKTCQKGTSSYLGLHVCVGGKAYTHYVHELVALAFHGARPVGHQVMHLDDNPRNNRADNLAYGTPAENVAQIWTTGRGRRGEKQPAAKLTADLVVAIRRAYAAGESQRSIARRVGCSHINVYKIVNRKKWAHVP